MNQIGIWYRLAYRIYTEQGMSQVEIVLSMVPHNHLHMRCQNAQLYLQLSPHLEDDRYPI